MTGLERLKEIAKSTNDFVISRCIALEMEIAGICDQIEREHLREVDDVSGRDSDILAWVESHGGIAELKSKLRDGERAKESVRRQQAHIESIQRTLSERGKRIHEMQQTLNEALPAAKWVRENGGVKECDRKVEASFEVGDKYTLLRMELGKLLGYDLMGQLDASDEDLVEKVGKRLMPEGMEWPSFEGGEPVKLGDSMEDDDGDEAEVAYITFHEAHVELGLFNGVETYPVPIDHGERVKRPATKVLDADGVEIRAGDVLYSIETGGSVTVESVKPGNPWFAASSGTLQHCSKFTHRAPVLAADGKPLREGETVWPKYPSGRDDEQVIRAIVLTLLGDGRVEVESEYPTGAKFHEYVRADQLTHERPESWERLEEDAKNENPVLYCKKRGIDCEDMSPVQAIRVDLVRRAKKLAGVEA